MEYINFTDYSLCYSLNTCKNNVAQQINPCVATYPSWMRAAEGLLVQVRLPTVHLKLQPTKLRA